MKASAVSIVIAAAIMAVVLLCLWPLLGQSWFYVKYTDIDLNSGDLRHQGRVCSLVVSTRIEESPLSREVRRLGIAVPANRVWTHAFEGRLVRGVCADYYYGRIFSYGRQLLMLLDLANAADEERRAVVERFITSLRTGNPLDTLDQTYLLMMEVDDKHGLNTFTPEFKAHVGELRDARKGQ